MIGKAESKPNLLLLVDPRARERFAEAHLPGARNIVLTDLRDDSTAKRDPRIADHKNIVVYGNNPAGTTARAMAKELMKLDYDGVRLYFGGMQEWTRAEPPDPEGRQVLKGGFYGSYQLRAAANGRRELKLPGLELKQCGFRCARGLEPGVEDDG